MTCTLLAMPDWRQRLLHGAGRLVPAAAGRRRSHDLELDWARHRPSKPSDSGRRQRTAPEDPLHVDLIVSSVRASLVLGAVAGTLTVPYRGGKHRDALSTCHLRLRGRVPECCDDPFRYPVLRRSRPDPRGTARMRRRHGLGVDASRHGDRAPVRASLPRRQRRSPPPRGDPEGALDRVLQDARRALTTPLGLGGPGFFFWSVASIAWSELRGTSLRGFWRVLAAHRGRLRVGPRPAGPGAPIRAVGPGAAPSRSPA